MEREGEATQAFRARASTLLPEWRLSESGEWVRDDDQGDTWPLAAVLAIAAIVIPLVLVVQAGRGSM